MTLLRFLITLRLTWEIKIQQWSIHLNPLSSNKVSCEVHFDLQSSGLKMAPINVLNSKLKWIKGSWYSVSVHSMSPCCVKQHCRFSHNTTHTYLQTRFQLSGRLDQHPESGPTATGKSHSSSSREHLRLIMVCDSGARSNQLHDSESETRLL